MKTPGFTLAAIVVLALGIGLNAAMFSVVHALAFAARPFPDPDQLVQLYSRDRREIGGFRAFSYPVYRELARRSDLFAGILAHNPSIVGIGDGAESRRAFSVLVSQNYFDVLGVPLQHGRGFTAAESQPGQNIAVVIASDAYWKRTGYDPTLVGKTIRINERPFTVVGITPKGFTGTMTVFGPELFFPLGVFDSLANDFTAAARSLDRTDGYNVFLVARLKDGVSIASASDAIGLYGNSLAQTFPAEHEHQVLSLAPLPKFGTSTSPSSEDGVTRLGMLLLAMTAAVLLTVCLNLTALMLARGRMRRREFAVRLALGGGRGRLVRQLLSEGMLLSMFGGALGLALGGYAIQAILASLTSRLPVTIVLEGSTSPALLGATLFFCVMAALAFALGPALKFSRADIVSDLKVHAGDDPVIRRWRLAPRNPLVIAQLALSLSLLIAAGLFIRMVTNATVVDLGYRADDTVVAEVDASLGGLDEAASLGLYAQVEERLTTLPGVHSASIGATVPLGVVSIGRRVRRAGVDATGSGRPTAPVEGQDFDTPWNAIGASYFDAMGIKLLYGRRFSTAETYGAGAPRVAIIDEPLARRLWPDGTAIGQSIQFAPRPGDTSPSPPMEVVGIVAATTRELLERTARGAVYVPFAQGFVSNAHFHVRPVVPSDDLIDAVRREIRAIAPGVPLFGVRTFRTHLDRSLEYWALRLSTTMFGFFGGMAMLVALVGIYGVTSYGVARRTREIGVRIAVGAKPRRVLRMILSESLGTTLSGVALGWILGLGVGRVMASTFVDLAGFDPWTFTLVPTALVAAAVAAALVPARRATAVNPVTALRSE